MVFTEIFLSFKDREFRSTVNFGENSRVSFSRSSTYKVSSTSDLNGLICKPPTYTFVFSSVDRYSAAFLAK